MIREALTLRPERKSPIALVALFAFVASSTASAATAESSRLTAEDVASLGVRCAMTAQMAVRQGAPLAEVDQCLGHFLRGLDTLEPADEYNIASDALMYFPCFGLGARKDKLVQSALHAAQALGDFDAAIIALFNRGVCYWNDKPAQFAKAMENFRPFRDALAPYVNPTYLDSPQQITDEIFAFRDMGRRYVRFLENAQRVDRGGTLCGATPSHCLTDAWSLEQRLKARMFHSRMLQTLIARDPSGQLAGLVRKQYALTQARESVRMGLKPFASGVGQDIAAINVQSAQTEEAISKGFPSYARFYASLAPPLSQIQSALTDNEIYVSYFFSDTDQLTDGRDRKMLAFRISKSGLPTLTQLPVGNVELKQLVTQLDEGIAQDVPIQSLSPLLQKIGAALVGSLKIPEYARVVVEVDESLASLPFTLLQVDGKQLFQRNEITYVPSAGVFLKLRSDKGSATVNRLYFGFGRATFDSGTPNLSAVTQEIAEAGKIFGANAVYRNSEAKESDLYQLKGEVERARVLHFATHTAWTGNEFALMLHDGNGEDGLLKESDIVGRVHTAADLVILSGCDTARLDSESNLPGEAFSSLTRAFFAAGARKMLVTQWQVRDQFASSFVAEFLRSYVTTNDGNRALRDAQTRIKNMPQATVKDWAAWVLVGD